MVAVACGVSALAVAPTHRTYSLRPINRTLQDPVRKLWSQSVPRTPVNRQLNCSLASRLRRGFPSTVLLYVPLSLLFTASPLNLPNNLRRNNGLGSPSQQVDTTSTISRQRFRGGSSRITSDALVGMGKVRDYVRKIHPEDTC